MSIYMAELKLKGRELIKREVKPHGNGAIVYIPRAWVGEKVVIIRGVE